MAKNLHFLKAALNVWCVQKIILENDKLIDLFSERERKGFYFNGAHHLVDLIRHTNAVFKSTASHWHWWDCSIEGLSTGGRVNWLAQYFNFRVEKYNECESFEIIAFMKPLKCISTLNDIIPLIKMAARNECLSSDWETKRTNIPSGYNRYGRFICKNCSIHFPPLSFFISDCWNEERKNCG